MNLRHLLARLWWYLRELAGETGYDHYVAHHREHHTAGAPLTRREYERLKSGTAVRCC
ncbi:YbdD/YjiX family protein [Dactylosporangium roseum]|uniref:YbdD/YjiX family protein n=1 Tax=Dactylosporangium roseum TaxID=47989 RepID=A0ABY5YX13_9ACTN|nr:YbdD/YjiX family protein [Dactylosporangium roseum]UWZ34284.1 YbdD/YjiX family protein [Dactylosporangium roseum]